MKKKSRFPTKRPWEHRISSDGLSSGVFDADGKIVCGSMLQNSASKDFANHELITRAVACYPICPMKSGIFGDDLDRFVLCTTCELWTACADEHERLDRIKLTQAKKER
jgi:hypothetical protein